jgi:cobalt-zinc-cadmium efflux system membrane fusion protein
MRWLAVSTIWWSAACHAESAGCLIEPDRVADVGSQAVGVLAQIKVERGDTVVTGQVLARLSAQVERATANIAQARSTAEAEYKQAVATSALAQRKLARTRDLLKQDFVSGQALDQAEAEARVAEQRVTQAKEAQHVALREYQLSAVQLGERDVRAPFDGIVLERYRTEGERIEREPVVRVARVDPLRVEAIVPANLFNTILVGQLAVIKTDLTLFPSLSAKVVLVDRVIDPASNSFRVRLALPNPNRRIPAGLRCRVNFVGATASTAPAPTPAPPGATPGTPPGPAASLSPKALTGPLRFAPPAAGQRPWSPAAPVPAPAPALATLDAVQVKTRLAAAALSLPGARLAEPSKSHDQLDRLGAKNYLYWRRARLSLSKDLALPGAAMPAQARSPEPLPAKLIVALR